MAALSAKKLQVALVTPEGELWSGEGEMVIAKTVEGEIGILPDHVPVLAALAPDCVVRVLGARETGELTAAVHGGFVSMEDNLVSVLAEVAELGEVVDVEQARAQLAANKDADDDDGRSRAAQARARLRAAGADVTV